MQLIKQCVLLMLFLHAVSCSAAPNDKDFQVYWNKFRAATVANDYSALAELTKVPLEVKGVDDSIPLKTYGKAELTKIFPKLMSQIVYQYKGEEVVEAPLKDILVKKERVEVSATDKEIRIEQFEFALVNDKWLLVRAYLEE